MLPCVNGLRQLSMDDVTGTSQLLSLNHGTFVPPVTSHSTQYQHYNNVQLGPSIQAYLRTKFTNGFTNMSMSHEVEVRIPFHKKGPQTNILALHSQLICYETHTQLLVEAR